MPSPNYAPRFVGLKRTKCVTLTTSADTSRTNPSSTTTLLEYTAGDAESGTTLVGHGVQKITVKATGATSENAVRIFYESGSTEYLWHEFIVPQTDGNDLDETWQDSWVPTEEISITTTGDSLVATNVKGSDGFVIIVQYGDY